MDTQFIGMREFRQNMTKYSELARKKNLRFIVLKKNSPMLEIRPIIPGEYNYINLKQELALAEQQIKNGESYTAEQVRQMLGLK